MRSRTLRAKQAASSAGLMEGKHALCSKGLELQLMRELAPFCVRFWAGAWLSRMQAGGWRPFAARWGALAKVQDVAR